MSLLIMLFVILIVLITVVHFWTSSRYMDAIGRPQKEYRDYLRRRKFRGGALTDIPAPPDGMRDGEVEALLASGDLEGASRLLAMRMEEAKLAPIGKEARIARVSHYMTLVRNARR